MRQKFYKIQYLGYDQKLYLEKDHLIKKSQIKRDLCLIKFDIKKELRKNTKLLCILVIWVWHMNIKLL